VSSIGKFKANPLRTYALVVGIEHYEIAEGWNLDGPAADAIRFVKWLRSRNVPAANIWLHIEALNKTEVAAALQSSGVVDHKATRECIRNRIIDLLGIAGDLLYLFWGGHGSTITPRDRRLYYADARSEDRQNLQINSLLDFLQSDRMRIKHQIAFIDACANIATQPGRLNVDQFPAMCTTSEVTQSFFFAAAAGQRAANDAVRRGGAFSEQVQAALDESSLDQFPPNPATIIQIVKKFLDQPDQTGVSYESQDWEGNIRASRGATEGPLLRSVAHKLRLPIQQLENLYQAFGKCPALQPTPARDSLANTLATELRREIFRPVEIRSDAPGDLLRQFAAAWPLHRGETFQRAFEQNEPISLEAEEVSGLLVRLRLLDDARVRIENLQQKPDLQLLLSATLPGAEIPAESPIETFLGKTLDGASDKLTAFFELLTRITESSAADPHIGAIQMILLNCGEQVRYEIRATLDAEAASLSHALLIQAIPGKPDRLSALWIRDDLRLMRKWEVECPLEENVVEEKVIEILAEIWRAGNFRMSIEVFLLPQTLHWTPDLWKRCDDFGLFERISTRHPVFVHWVKRWSEPGTAGDWNRASEAVRAHINNGCEPVCSFLKPGDINASIIAAELIEGKRGALVAFTFPIVIQPGKTPPREFVAAIRSGAPYVCWLREVPQEWEQFRREIESLVPQPLNSEDFAKIPHRVLVARKAAAEEPPPDPPVIVGGNLTLLWDDDRRSPFENKYRPPI
jgi:vWA-MoxR associated protein C-terminal domain/Caspase domain